MPKRFDSRSSDFNDGMEALLMRAEEPVDICEGDQLISQVRSHTPDSTQSHDFKNCPGQVAYGQGAPVYPCGCYQYSKRYSSFYGVEPLQELEPPEVADALSEAGQRMIEQIDGWKAQVENGSGEMRPLKRKRSTSDVGNVTPRRFGQDTTNTKRATSAPVPEVSQILKRRKLREAFEWKGSRTHETLLKVGKDIEAAINRHTEVLSKLNDILESRASLG
ncbi:hypothetical protein EDD22DRAFT_955736 [Suillus occidentalis]|nr:hypothetical protein EDD22DRAFT_955736 [Suillus occidentalis]